MVSVENTLPAFIVAAQRFLDSAREQARGGLTWAEFGSLVAALVRLSVEMLDAVQTLSGPEKKAIVLESVGVLFDTLAVMCVPISVYPFWFIVRAPARALVVAIAAGTIETILPLVRSSK
jgi:hypothetical protein